MEFLTIDQAAIETGKPENEIRLLIKKRFLPVLKIGKQIFIHKAQLLFLTNLPPPENKINMPLMY